MCQNLNVSLLGKVPLDPQIGNVTVLHYNLKLCWCYYWEG